MKKVFVGLVGMLLCVAMAGCTVVSKTAPSSSAPSQSDDASTFSSQPSSSASSKEENLVGTRTNPVPLGQTGLYDGLEEWEGYQVEVTATEVIRGEDAKAKVIAWNKYNDQPDEGQEYVVVKVTVKVLETKDDEAADISNYDFDFFSQEGTKYEHPVVAGIEPDLTETYAGGSTEGYVCGIVTAEDNATIRYNDTLWLALQ